MSDKIKRSQVDDINRRNNAADSYKNRSFGKKKSVIDEYTGDKIFYNANKHINEKQSNVDHIVPLDEQIRRYGSDLTPEQIRTMANDDALFFSLFTPSLFLFILPTFVIRIDRRRCSYRPTQTSAPTDADARNDRRG